MPITRLVTHSGGFHADELLSSVVLTHIFPQAELIRSRDREMITPAADKIIYDVGNLYDVDAQIFDHHQRPGPLREDEQPFSSFGLIWKHYGREYLAALNVPADRIDAIHAKFDEKFVLPIDLLDNGAMEPSVAGPLSILTLPSLLVASNPFLMTHRQLPMMMRFSWRCQSRAVSPKRKSVTLQPKRALKVWY